MFFIAIPGKINHYTGHARAREPCFQSRAGAAFVAVSARKWGNGSPAAGQPLGH